MPFLDMHTAGLGPEGRPVGIFLLLGPTGVGKTHLVESIASHLHGKKSMLKVDCGDFLHEQDTAKLIGAPPGYIGHRETPPLLTQRNIEAAKSDQSNLAVILFDEIEKAPHNLQRLLLSVLDKATLRLNDNTTSNFEQTLIFMTSNLGAAKMNALGSSGLGFQHNVQDNSRERLHSIGHRAVTKHLSPEFVGRIDKIITFNSLTSSDYTKILNIELAKFRAFLVRRLGPRSFNLLVTDEAKQAILVEGVGAAYGARHLKQTISKRITHPMVRRMTDGIKIPKDGLTVHYHTAAKTWTIT